MTHAEVLAVIQAALSQRPAGQKVLVSAHEAAEIKILDYIEQAIGSIPVLTEGQVNTTAGMQSSLSWANPFPNSYYTFIVNGFDATGAPVEINLIDKHPGYITIKTFVASTVHAIAISHNQFI